jgi:deoxyadenosine/deoxycytidine kinase
MPSTPQGGSNSKTLSSTETEKKWQPSFVIEGNIGVGKSTLLNLCRSDAYFEKHFKIYCEPIEKWQNVGGKGRFNILDEFYKGKDHQSLSFFICGH